MTRTAAGWSAVDADRGRPIERTSLSWQRTSLSVAVGVAVVARLQSERLGPGLGLLLVAGVALALWAAWAGSRRVGTGRPRDGAPHLALCLALVLVAAVEVATMTGPPS